VRGLILAWIPFYADKADIALIVTRLNNDADIAYILRGWWGRWKACRTVEDLEDGSYCLWHVPGGPIASYVEGKADILGNALRKRMGIAGNMLEEHGVVQDPWKGWKGPHVTGQKNVPFLGTKPNIIDLSIHTSGSEGRDSIGLSCFGWIEQRYASIGSPASKATVEWWKRLERWVSEHATGRIPRFGPANGPDPEIWGFPSAHERILHGTRREANPL